ncbi:MAG: anthranilate synthase component I family protein [Candidatus Nanopelagicales bacterium]|nr:anthranilate synthase component I family protein [Candidatus Nanopelagicales bacterium]
MTPARPPIAVLGGQVGRDLVEVASDPRALDAGGRWAVAITFEGALTLARFAQWTAGPPSTADAGPWSGPDPGAWRTSMGRAQYEAAVRDIQDRIARGEVYQANLCRVLRAPVDPDADVVALWWLLSRGNPAPHAGALRLPDHGVHLASASPELFLRRTGALLESGPIKGTGVTAADLRPKDVAENVMIVDLVRNDLGRISRPGTVTVPDLLAVEEHPGLVHLVSTVAGQLAAGVGWSAILEATFPPGSVTGAPKLAALDVIRTLEPVPRGPYCGTLGWIDADTGTAELAVTIRTFWREDGPGGTTLCFGTGAGITWASDPAQEWQETELKADRLLRVAAGTSRWAREREGPA